MVLERQGIQIHNIQSLTIWVVDKNGHIWMIMQHRNIMVEWDDQKATANSPNADWPIVSTHHAAPESYAYNVTVGWR